MQIVPMRNLRDTVEIERLCASGNPVFVTKNGYGRLVVMDIESYERTIREMHEAKLVNESLGDIENGAALIDGDKVKQRIMARYGGQEI